MLFAYNYVEHIGKFFGYLYVDIEAKKTHFIKYNNLRTTTIMSIIVFSTITREIIFNVNLSYFQY